MKGKNSFIRLKRLKSISCLTVDIIVLESCFGFELGIKVIQKLFGYNYASINYSDLYETRLGSFSKNYKRKKVCTMRIIVAISGASGAIYGYRLIQVLMERKVEVHLVISPWAKKTIELELGISYEDVLQLAGHCYEYQNMAEGIASGSFFTDGMVIAPCSMKTLAGIAHGYDDNLIVRAANVTLKEQRKLILLTRETPLTPIYLENMLKLARMGAVVMPPVPAFYNQPLSIKQIVDHSVGRILDHLKVEHHLMQRWGTD